MNAHILVIDDTEEITEIISIALLHEGYHVTSFHTGEDALHYLHDENRPDIILLDILLPDINGIDLLHQIKQIDETIPVIMITAFAEVKSAVKAMKAGASDYVSKPFKLEELKSVIRQNLQGVRADMANRPAPTLEEVEREYIKQTLIEFNGNRRKAADALGISVRALYYKIKQYDLGNI